MRSYLAEAIGAFFVVLAVGVTSDIFGIGFILTALYFLFAGVSGAHFNPAVSFAFFLKKDITIQQFFGYSFFQLLGAFAGAGVMLYLTQFVFFVEPPTATNLFQQSVSEFSLVFLLVAVYLWADPHHPAKPQGVHAIILGLTMAGITVVGRELSGSFFNPAISLGVSIVDFISIEGTSYRSIPLYTLAPLAGASAAAFAYAYFYGED